MPPPTITVQGNNRSAPIVAENGRVNGASIRTALLIEEGLQICLWQSIPGTGDVSVPCHHVGQDQIFTLIDGDNLATTKFRVDVESRPADQDEQAKLKALGETPPYISWANKMKDRMLYSFEGGFKRCVTPVSRTLALTYRHGIHKALELGSELTVYSDKVGTFEPFKASVVAFDDLLDVVLLKAPEGKFFAAEDFRWAESTTGSHYVMTGFSNEDAWKLPRTSFGYITTATYRADDGEIRCYGSSGAAEGDSGAGCFDRNGALIGINVSAACSAVRTVEGHSVVLLHGGKNAITPMMAIMGAFGEHFPTFSKRPIIE